MQRETFMSGLLPTKIEDLKEPSEMKILSTTLSAKPQLRFFSVPGCSFRTEMLELSKIFREEDVGIDIVEVDASDMNSGNQLLSEMFKVVGFPTFIYTSQRSFGNSASRGVLQFNPDENKFFNSFRKFIDIVESNELLNRKLEDVEEKLKTTSRLF